jgi:hypothetical protein
MSRGNIVRPPIDKSKSLAQLHRRPFMADLQNNLCGFDGHTKRERERDKESGKGS